MLRKMLSHLLTSPVSGTISSRMREFSKPKTKEQLFEELCFCILAANYQAGKSWDIQRRIGKGFLSLSKDELSLALKKLGYRFPNIRASYIVEARKHIDTLPSVAYELEEGEARRWLVENVKGIGMKEASHFLRNVGRKNLAILDIHILRLMEKEGIARKPKTLTPKKYIEIEEILRKVAEDLSISVAELDLYLWFLATGNVLK